MDVYVRECNVCVYRNVCIYKLYRCMDIHVYIYDVYMYIYVMHICTYNVYKYIMCVSMIYLYIHI